jgi:hypothetical protein
MVTLCAEPRPSLRRRVANLTLEPERDAEGWDALRWLA